MTEARKYRLHFVAIGGIGMSGIAEIFLRQGHEVSGSDLSQNDQTDHLARMGARICIGHDARNIPESTDVVVVSSAVGSNNPEYIEAKRRRIPVIRRAEILAEILRGKTGITVAGTHGKTTTTSMIAQVMIAAGLDPTVAVGGRVEAIGSNAKYGLGNLVVAEADESDGSFLLLPSVHCVVTNIDFDHMEYYQTTERLDEAFVQFVKNLPFYGCAWLCGDDAGVRRVLPSLTKPFQTYGFTDGNDLVAREHRVEGTSQSARLIHRGRDLGELTLNVLGQHNFLNAMAAVGVSISVGVPFEKVRAVLAEFRHVRRRFDERFHDPKSGIRVVDDYGHHPTEIRAVLATARDMKPGRVVTVFQPHRYTRTLLCWDQFLSCFDATDVLLLLPIYSAGEEAIEGVSSHALIRELHIRNPKLGDRIVECRSLEEAEQWLLAQRCARDLILTLGAGSVTQLAGRLASSLGSVL